MDDELVMFGDLDEGVAVVSDADGFEREYYKVFPRNGEGTSFPEINAIPCDRSGSGIWIPSHQTVRLSRRYNSILDFQGEGRIPWVREYGEGYDGQPENGYGCG